MPEANTITAATAERSSPVCGYRHTHGGAAMNGVIYLVGLVVVILAILSFFGLR